MRVCQQRKASTAPELQSASVRTLPEKMATTPTPDLIFVSGHAYRARPAISWKFYTLGKILVYIGAWRMPCLRLCMNYGRVVIKLAARSVGYFIYTPSVSSVSEGPSRVSDLLKSFYYNMPAVKETKLLCLVYTRLPVYLQSLPFALAEANAFFENCAPCTQTWRVATRYK